MRIRSILSNAAALCVLVTLGSAQGTTCATPIPISGTGTWNVQWTVGSVSGFDGGGAGPCYWVFGGQPGSDTFFVWTADTAGEFEFTVPAIFSSVTLQIHDGSDCSATCAYYDAAYNGGNAWTTEYLARIAVPSAVQGDSYLVQVAAWTDAGTTGTLQVTPGVYTPPPVNNTCATPTVIGGLGTLAYDSTFATSSEFDGGVGSACSPNASFHGVRQDVFFSWIVPTPGDYEVFTSGPDIGRSAIAVHSGSDCSATCLAFDSYSGGIRDGRVQLPGLMSGDALLFQAGVWHENTSRPGLLTVSTLRPNERNDDCSSPTPLSSAGMFAWDTVLTTTSGFDGGNPNLCMSPQNPIGDALGAVGHDLFWTFTAPCDGAWTFSTKDSPWETRFCRLNIHQGTDCSATCIEGHSWQLNLLPTTFYAEVTLPSMLQGDTVLIQLGNLDNPAFTGSGLGNGVLTITHEGVAGTTSVLCDPAIDHSGGLPATLSATWDACNGGTSLHLDASDGPADQFGYFLVSNQTTGGTPSLDGVLCIGPTIGRYSSAIAGILGIPELDSLAQFDAAGVLQSITSNAPSSGGRGFDVPTELPGTIGQTIASGDTWHFQLWYRDQGPGGPTANLSNVLSVTFP